VVPQVLALLATVSGAGSPQAAPASAGMARGVRINDTASNAVVNNNSLFLLPDLIFPFIYYALINYTIYSIHHSVHSQWPASIAVI